ncbi:hypothetical protein HDU97_006966 [Phlyctochytrium planicorne]|nr:hypothetical protein HDU97_006966 [Phlyctochytrium planicorne]
MPWLFHSKVSNSGTGEAVSPKPFFPIRSSITGYHRESSAVPSFATYQQQQHNQQQQQQQQHQQGTSSPRSSSPAPPNYLIPRASLTLPPGYTYPGGASPSTAASILSNGDSPTGANVRKKDILALKNDLGPKLIIVMVGLPARGKSYLSWCGFNTRVFNVGNRRRVMGSDNPLGGPPAEDSHHDESGRPPPVPSPTPRNPLEAPTLVLPASLVPPPIHPSRPDSSSSNASSQNFKLHVPISDMPGSGSFMMSPISSTPNSPDQPGLEAPVPRRPVPSPLSLDVTPASPDTEDATERNEDLDKVGEGRAGAQNAEQKKRKQASTRDADLAAHSPVVVSAPGTSHDAAFFDPKNENAKAIRERLAMDTLDEAIDWLKHSGGKVAIHDATNSTVERRRNVLERVAKEKNMQAIFIESICTDEKVLESNIMMKLKGPDYINMPQEEAIRDFKARMFNYEKAYETISEEEEQQEDVSYIKIINVGKKVIANNIHGYIASQCVFYLMQIHIKEHTLWLTRHGESIYNAYNRIGGDPPLTELGHRYAAALSRFIQKIHPPSVESVTSSSSSIPHALDIQSQSISLTHPLRDEPESSDDVSEMQHPSSSPRRRRPLSDDFGGGTSVATSKARASITGVSPSARASVSAGPQDHPESALGGHAALVKAAADAAAAASTPQGKPLERQRPLAIWTSTLERTVQSVEGFSPDDYEIKHMRNLNEISAGLCENLTYEEIEAHYPAVWAERLSNKLLFRYPGPGGESYSDVIERLRPVIVELERMESDVLIVSHQVVMRTLLAYFCGLPLAEMTTLSVPLHTLYRVKPTPYGADLIKYEWNPITDEFDMVGTTL